MAAATTTTAKAARAATAAVAAAASRKAFRSSPSAAVSRSARSSTSPRDLKSQLDERGGLQSHSALFLRFLTVLCDVWQSLLPAMMHLGPRVLIVDALDRGHRFG